MMSEKAKKVLDITTKVLTYLLTAFTVFMMVFTIVTVTTVDKNERSFFGYRFYIVKTDSMSKSENNAHMDVHFNAGDIIIVQNVKDPTALEAGDIITFISTNEESYFETITHMIRDREYNNGQFVGYKTFGTNTGVDDESIVEPGYVLGKYAAKLPAVGQFFAFVKTTPGYIVCILVPFLLLILYNGVNVIRLFKQYRTEQMSAMQAERDKIDAERAENLRMMEELMALKEQLLKQQAAAPTPAEPTVAPAPVEPTPEPIPEPEAAEEPTPELEPIEEAHEEESPVEEAVEETAESSSEELEELLETESTAQPEEASAVQVEEIAEEPAEADSEPLEEETPIPEPSESESLLPEETSED